MEQQRETAAVDLFDGIDELIDGQFGGLGYHSKTAALSLGRSGSHRLNGEVFVGELFEQLQLNWKAALATSPKGSSQNFRWHAPQLTIAPHNKSPEVTLERALIQACVSAGRRDWSNQVPLISGISGSRAYKRRAVDLVHRREDGGFELVELKVGSDTPLFAAMEILIYGLLWLLSRRDRDALGYGERPVLDASVLHFTVLAPRRFYRGIHLSEFMASLDTGIASLGRSFGVEMRFRQMAFPEAFQWPATYTDAELLEMLDGRELV